MSDPIIGAAAVRENGRAIAARLLYGNETISQVARDCRTADGIICEVYSQHTTAKQRMRAQIRKWKANPTASKFPAGHVPWNKGKSVRLSPATEFKPGTLRGNAAQKWCAVGTVKKRNDHGTRCWMIKVRDDGPQRWVAVARHEWEKTNGPVPKGQRVIHLDGDSLNDVLSNLASMTPREALAHFQNINPRRVEKFRRNSAKVTKARHETRRQVKSATAATAATLRPAVERKLLPTTAQDKARARLASFLRELQEVA